jgi:hypothetical protein
VLTASRLKFANVQTGCFTASALWAKEFLKAHGVKANVLSSTRKASGNTRDELFNATTPENRCQRQPIWSDKIPMTVGALAIMTQRSKVYKQIFALDYFIVVRSAGQ